MRASDLQVPGLCGAKRGLGSWELAPRGRDGPFLRQKPEAGQGRDLPGSKPAPQRAGCPDSSEFRMPFGSIRVPH